MSDPKNSLLINKAFNGEGKTGLEISAPVSDVISYKKP